MSRVGLIVMLCGALAGIPALASARGERAAGPTFTAVDDSMTTASWHANGTNATTVTIAPGESVAFEYPAQAYGGGPHNVRFTDMDAQPASCTDMPGEFAPQPAPWSGSCRFDRKGSYPFNCVFHANMKGTVVVANPPATATATPTQGGPYVTPTPTPTPEPGVTPTPQTTLRGAVRLASAQRGSRVRGTVAVKAAKSRLEVALFVPRSKLSGGKSHRAVRVGRWVKASTAAGSVRFSVPLSARARSALRRAGRLAVTVSVALTPPGGHKLTRRLHTTVRRPG
jgi:plastocyanin